MRKVLSILLAASCMASLSLRGQEIIDGTSWGGTETVTLARELERRGIPVLLTIQVDSIAKPGQENSKIPANVENAVNFYQPRGLLLDLSGAKATAEASLAASHP